MLAANWAQKNANIWRYNMAMQWVYFANCNVWAHDHRGPFSFSLCLSSDFEQKTLNLCWELGCGLTGEFCGSTTRPVCVEIKTYQNPGTSRILHNLLMSDLFMPFLHVLHHFGPFPLPRLSPENHLKSTEKLRTQPLTSPLSEGPVLTAANKGTESNMPGTPQTWLSCSCTGKADHYQMFCTAGKKNNVVFLMNFYFRLSTCVDFPTCAVLNNNADLTASTFSSHCWNKPRDGLRVRNDTPNTSSPATRTLETDWQTDHHPSWQMQQTVSECFRK